MIIDEEKIRKMRSGRGPKGLIPSLRMSGGGRESKFLDFMRIFIGVSMAIAMILASIWFVWTLLSEGNKLSITLGKTESPNASQVEVIYKPSTKTPQSSASAKKMPSAFSSPDSHKPLQPPSSVQKK